jgi:tetratricopeptide (TPR) repeat protein
VFLASPGGLEEERRALRDEIERFNQDFMHEALAAFSAEGWERVPGGKRRAQELINEQLRQCDFMVLMLWNRWGTAPDAEGPHTSGTEEEFRLASQLIESADHPMRDALIVFKGVPEAQLSDPGDQLKRVLAFKKELEESKDWLYKTFDSVDELRSEVRSRLLSWAKLTSGDETPTREPEAAHHVSHESNGGGTEDEPPANMLARAESFAARGLVTQAEAAYAGAIADDDVDALESYARFLRRIGRPSRSLEIGERTIEVLAQRPDTLETSIRTSGVMASIGITQRKLGKLRESRYSLTEAVQAIRGTTESEIRSLAYALDNLGITAMRSGDLPSAREAFQRSLELRSRVTDARGKAETLLNLARLDRRVGEGAEASRRCDEALALLDAEEHRATYAAANALLGELREAAGDLSGAEAAFKEALASNEASGHPASIALSVLQLARLLLAKGDISEAKRLAERANDENTHAANREGVIASQHLLGRVALAGGRIGESIGLLQDCVVAYTQIGNPTGEAWASLHLGEALGAAGLEAEAQESVRRSGVIAEATENAALRASLVEFHDRELGTTSPTSDT